MSSKKIDKYYIREVELCVPTGHWDRQLKRDLK